MLFINIFLTFFSSDKQATKPDKDFEIKKKIKQQIQMKTMMWNISKLSY